jgi:GMP synthase (glutamine-hydrolysing)
MSKKVTVFKHSSSDGARLLRIILEEKGFDVQSLVTPSENINDFDALSPDLLIVMGGSPGVYQAEHYPFLQQEIRILEKRLQADLPTIGVCLGSQMMAKALGAEVYKGSQGKELAWHPLTLLEAGKNHPVRHLCAPHTSMFHWHGDTFDLPQGATLLASSEKYKHQIYTHGKNALALQCHTELRLQDIQEWLVTHVDDVVGSRATISIEEARKQTAENIDTLNRQTRLFMNEWLEQVGLA